MEKDTNVLEFRTQDYFDEESLYLFYDDTKFFKSKVHFYNGYCYTNESLNYKATTLKCIKLCQET